MSEDDLHFLNFYYPSDYLEAYHNLQKVRWGDEYSSYSFRGWFDIPVGSPSYTRRIKNLETIVELGFENVKRFNEFVPAGEGSKISLAFIDEILGNKLFYFLCCLYSEALLGQILHSEYGYHILSRPDNTQVHELNFGTLVNPNPIFVFYVHDAAIDNQIKNKKIKKEGLSKIFIFLSEKTIQGLNKTNDKRVKKIFAEHSSKVVEYLENIEKGLPKNSDRL